MKPMLCRVSSYCRPGLPRPTMRGNDMELGSFLGSIVHKQTPGSCWTARATMRSLGVVTMFWGEGCLRATTSSGSCPKTKSARARSSCWSRPVMGASAGCGSSKCCFGTAQPLQSQIQHSRHHARRLRPTPTRPTGAKSERVVKQRFREIFYHRPGSGRKPWLFPPTPKLSSQNRDSAPARRDRAIRCQTWG